MTATDALKTGKPRIAYIDLLKGICIIIIVMMHCDLLVTDDVPASVTPLRVVPLYFFLSGLFFKPYADFREFLLRKVDTLIVPYVFFQVLLGGILLTKIALTHTFYLHSPDDLVRIATVINGPLWFLRCLFLINLAYYALVRFVQNKWWIGGLTILIAGATWWANKAGYLSPEHIRAPWNFVCIHFLRLPQVMFALPLFFAGHVCNKLLARPFTLKFELPLLIAAAGLLVLTAHPMNMFASRYVGTFPEFYIAALCYVLVWIIICRIFVNIPGVTYLGRYSLIVLGMHLPMIMLLENYITNRWLLLACVILSMAVIIPFFKRLFPHMTAQKSLFVRK